MRDIMLLTDTTVDIRCLNCNDVLHISRKEIFYRMSATGETDDVIVNSFLSDAGWVSHPIVIGFHQCRDCDSSSTPTAQPENTQ